MDQRAGMTIFIVVVGIILAVCVPGFIKSKREESKQKKNEEEKDK